MRYIDQDKVVDMPKGMSLIREKRFSFQASML